MAKSISPATLYEKLKNKERLVLCDIRNVEESKDWGLPDSLNIPFDKLSQKISSLPFRQLIIVYDNRGNESKKAARFLRQRGFNAVHLAGGLSEWNNIYDIVEVTPENSSSFKVYQVKRLGKGCLSYIIADPKRKKAILVDPTRHDKVYLEFLKKNKLKLAATADTHIHADHISGGKLIAKKRRVPYLYYRFEPSQPGRLITLTPMEKKLNKLFKTKVFEVIPTPGHTPESVAIKLSDSFIFTGDTLFIESVGQPDLTGDENTEGNSRLLWQSIKEKIFHLDEDLFILPGHTKQQLSPDEPMISASLRYVKRANEIAEIDKVDEFVKKMLESRQPPPANHLTIKEMNKTGKRKRVDLDELELGANGCAAEL